ncbi:hypothetical protein [Streptomyces sp. NPDC002758]
MAEYTDADIDTAIFLRFSGRLSACGGRRVEDRKRDEGRPGHVGSLSSGWLAFCFMR